MPRRLERDRSHSSFGEAVVLHGLTSRPNRGETLPGALVGEGVSEMRIDYGPGYRVYFKRQSGSVVVLLTGGNKGTQRADIETALRLARNL